MDFESAQVEAMYNKWCIMRNIKPDRVFLGIGISAALSFFASPRSTGNWVTGYTLIACIVIMVGLLALNLGKQAYYIRIRDPAYIILANLGHVAAATCPMLYTFKMHKKSDREILLLLLLAKLPGYVHSVTLNTVKASLMPFTAFTGVLLLHMGVLYKYEATLDNNVYLRGLTKGANTLIAPVTGSIPLLCTQEGACVFTPRVCTTALWIMLQSAAFWALYFRQLRRERQLRDSFLAANSLPPDLPRTNPAILTETLLHTHLRFLFVLPLGSYAF